MRERDRVREQPRTVHTPAQYRNAHTFLGVLKNNSSLLTKEEAHDLRERALNGDVEGAYYALDMILQVKCG